MWKTGVANLSPYLQARPSKRLHTIKINIFQTLHNSLLQLIRRDKIIIGIYGDHKAIWDMDPKFTQIEDHFTQRCVLAPYLCQVVHADRIQGDKFLLFH